MCGKRFHNLRVCFGEGPALFIDRFANADDLFTQVFDRHREHSPGVVTGLRVYDREEQRVVRGILYVYRFATHGNGASNAEARVKTNLLVVESKKRAQLTPVAVEAEDADQIGAEQIFDLPREQIHQSRKLSLRVHPSDDRE